MLNRRCPELSREPDYTSPFADQIHAPAIPAPRHPTPSNCLNRICLAINGELNLGPEPNYRENLLAPELEARSQRQALLQYPENSE